MPGAQVVLQACDHYAVIEELEPRVEGIVPELFARHAGRCGFGLLPCPGFSLFEFFSDHDVVLPRPVGREVRLQGPVELVGQNPEFTGRHAGQVLGHQ